MRKTKQGCFGCMAKKQAGDDRIVRDSTTICGLCDGFYCDACIGPHYDVDHKCAAPRPAPGAEPSEADSEYRMEVERLRGVAVQRGEDEALLDAADAITKLRRTLHRQNACTPPIEPNASELRDISAKVAGLKVYPSVVSIVVREWERLRAARQPSEIAKAERAVVEAAGNLLDALEDGNAAEQVVRIRELRAALERAREQGGGE